eukprot:9986794-Ditylum_brightwellii.AAC.1
MFRQDTILPGHMLLSDDMHQPKTLTLMHLPPPETLTLTLMPPPNMLSEIFPLPEDMEQKYVDISKESQ